MSFGEMKKTPALKAKLPREIRVEALLPEGTRYLFPRRCLGWLHALGLFSQNRVNPTKVVCTELPVDVFVKSRLSAWTNSA